jgi:hypothetical protein
LDGFVWLAGILRGGRAAYNRGEEERVANGELRADLAPALFLVLMERDIATRRGAWRRIKKCGGPHNGGVRRDPLAGGDVASPSRAVLERTIF